MSRLVIRKMASSSWRQHAPTSAYGEIRFVEMPREKSQRLDVLVLNPPSPDGDLFLRDIARVGRRTRDGIIWPQTALAQIGAVVQEAGYSVDVVDAIGLGMTWKILSAICGSTNRAI